MLVLEVFGFPFVVCSAPGIDRYEWALAMCGKPHDNDLAIY